MKTIICGLPFEIQEIEPSSRSDMNLGMSDSKQMLITIKKDMPKEMKELTLIHEYIHMVLDNYAMEETNNEQLVQTLASELYRTGFRVKVEK